VESAVVDAKVVRELMDDGHPDLIGEVLGVCEVGLERKTEQGDPVRDGRPVRAPLSARDSLVEAVQRLVHGDLVLGPLLLGWLVRDDDRDLVEGARERLGDRIEGDRNELVETTVSREETGGSRTATALGHCARILRAMDHVPAPDHAAEPDGFVVVVEPGDRIHFVDWGPGTDAGAPQPDIVLVHGLSNTAWSWAPIARRLGSLRHVVAMDLRGHGLSDAPTDGYDPKSFAGDVLAVAEGSGSLTTADDQVVLAGHGFGGIVAAWAAAEMGERCAGLVLVDGGWESIELASGVDVDEFLRGLDEPPEVMRSMAAYLADREAFDPASWDADQEAAARATVVETHAGKVVPSTRPHALEASVRAMFRYDPLATLPDVTAPVTALVAGIDETGARAAALASASAARVQAGRSRIVAASFERVGHNLMRYRPEAVSAAILSVAGDRGI
jgi:pimeloyl-ACP methyl ester carboxylesterase